MSGPRARWAIALVAAFLLAGAARAEGIGARFTLDNDHFDFWIKPGDRPDFGYTHGTELALRWPRAPRALVGLVPAALIGGNEDGREAALEVSVRQSLFSPWRLPEDRPYAGWLGASLGLTRDAGAGRREFRIHAGVTGPPSLAGATQRYFHHRFDHGREPDWSGQLPFEPSLGLEAAAWRLAMTRGAGAGPRILAGGLLRARAGTDALDLRIGLPLVAGIGAPALWPMGGSPGRGPSLYVRLHPKLDVIARDEFLDGTLFRSSPGPGSRALVVESEAALGLGWTRSRLEWAVMRRSREFTLQPAPHTFASLQWIWLP